MECLLGLFARLLICIQISLIYTNERILFYVALYVIKIISRQIQKPEIGTMTILSMELLYSAQYHKQHCTPQASGRFGALYMYMHSLDGKHPQKPAHI